MEQFFSTQHVIKTFKVSHQTVKNWCKEFAAYLSTSARPGEGRKRVFSTDDMRVFALLNEYHKRGFSYEEAHIALRNGQRGDLPETEGEITPTVPPALLMQLREELATRDRLIQQLTSERDRERGKVELLREQLDERERRIEELMQENAKLRFGGGGEK